MIFSFFLSAYSAASAVNWVMLRLAQHDRFSVSSVHSVVNLFFSSPRAATGRRGGKRSGAFVVLVSFTVYDDRHDTYSHTV